MLSERAPANAGAARGTDDRFARQPRVLFDAGDARAAHPSREGDVEHLQNQALIALMATVFMTVYGKQGLRALAEQNLAKAHYLAGKLQPRFSGKFFNEFVVRTNGKTPAAINEALLGKQIIGGLPLGRFYPELDGTMLLCATEMSRREDMDKVAVEFGA
jgi:glycine dehydrogenase subunit 1